MTLNYLNYKKTGNFVKNSDEPCISVGIICFKLNKTIYKTFLQNLSITSYYDLSNLILNNIHLFNHYNDMIEFMLVKRRHSLNYIEFIRGKYDPYDVEQVRNMFSLMSTHEVDMIKSQEFDHLWENLWMKNAHNKKYMAEFNQSKEHFNMLKQNSMDIFISEYKDTEWEIPKGRKKTNEKNIECAVREFKEETNIAQDDYVLMRCVDPIHDNFIGTNSKKYRHIFYTALITTDVNIMDCHNCEIEMVKWCKWSELNDIIRPYNNNKINILTNVLLFIMNTCENDNYMCLPDKN